MLNGRVTFSEVVVLISGLAELPGKNRYCTSTGSLHGRKDTISVSMTVPVAIVMQVTAVQLELVVQLVSCRWFLLEVSRLKAAHVASDCC